MPNQPKLIFTMHPNVNGLNALSCHQLLALTLPAHISLSLTNIAYKALATGQLFPGLHATALHFFNFLPPAFGGHAQLPHLSAYFTYLSQNLPAYPGAPIPHPEDLPIFEQAAHTNLAQIPMAKVTLTATINAWLCLATFCQFVATCEETGLNYRFTSISFLQKLCQALHNNHFTPIAEQIQDDLAAIPPQYRSDPSDIF